ncbi:hypothetical protein ADICYQ_4958 [Cyclobacterium qasimii M12-11B]|uniref:Uncharacterized protein n=3 Tax=Cyclobacterium qasimii TaxID=1350429 RepID=S7WGX9_9BACT|nr:hypothetical protein ADICYQ_4958 [Cyclobacterium qasimii M12-11B]GEO20067.1 hypothetical protein CQA01_06010 [Cyclobacterium qasimii]
MTVATFSYAQKNNDLTGPAAKNQKPWQNTEKAKKVYTLETTSKAQGPSAKNKKSWESTSKNYQQVTLVTNKTRVTGPKAKNAKVWND